VNHLAHALVAHRAGGSIVGNLMGDFVKGDPRGRFDGALLEGILLHRRVDAFVDAHASFARSRARIRPELRRWAGVLVDIFYDHLLARRWEEFCDRELRAFADGVYAALRAEWHVLPERMTGFAQYMLDTDLLVAYREEEGVARALAGLSRRVRGEGPLRAAIAELERERAGFDADFGELFPDLLRAFGIEQAAPRTSRGGRT
jgi:acyl carrier protein phosphodiesterase